MLVYMPFLSPPLVQRYINFSFFTFASSHRFRFPVRFAEDSTELNGIIDLTEKQLGLPKLVVMGGWVGVWGKEGDDSYVVSLPSRVFKLKWGGGSELTTISPSDGETRVVPSERTKRRKKKKRKLHQFVPTCFGTGVYVCTAD